MAFGLGVLRLPPDAFWNMTLIELASAARGALGLGAGGPHFDRGALSELMTLFPD